MQHAIEIRDICKRYPNFSLQNVSFNVPSGSIVGFVGENGAGKTTTIKAILGINKLDSGSIRLLGQDIADAGAASRADVGVVFDESAFHDWLRADQVASVLKNIYPTWDAAYFAQLMQRFQLPQDKKTDIKSYSRGMKMKLSLAAALAHRPKLLVLDEATSGLDPIVRDEILDMFLDFIQDEEHSILFSSHITSDIEKAADYLVFIHEGQIVLNAEKDLLLEQYGVLRCTAEAFATVDQTHVKGSRKSGFGVEALIDNRPDFVPMEGAVVDRASVDDIMLYTIRGRQS
ncbi:ABC transporter ATP-binding protein [Ruminococcaceae bacterium OttesenSCG-928-O06]|nr:ABC transporter ATP-binding protein [Ruminococcaceae bacterium OttesenSCG-928-O06]